MQQRYRKPGLSCSDILTPFPPVRFMQSGETLGLIITFIFFLADSPFTLINAKTDPTDVSLLVRNASLTYFKGLFVADKGRECCGTHAAA